jgi:predicted phosphodiesterase
MKTGVKRRAWRLLGAIGPLLGIVSCGGEELDRSVRRATRTSIRVLQPAPGALALPLRDGSVRFAVIGDAGRGDQLQYDIARQMYAWRDKFPFEFVVMLGDNIYPPHTPEDYRNKFEEPYRPLLDAGVTFQAAIGNHDDEGELKYGPFNMGGRRYYTFRRSERRIAGLTGSGVRFFVLDSRSLDPAQLTWLKDELKASGTEWKICYMHHPLYTSGRYRSGARALRTALEPILVDGDVDVVLSGHEHFYERLVPQRGIAYFISGGGGALRRGDIRPSVVNAAGYDEDCHFMLVEVSGKELYFQAIGRDGRTVDAGVITKEDSATADKGPPREFDEPSLERLVPTLVDSVLLRSRRRTS